MLTWFIARRLFASSDGARRVSRPAIRIATLGVAVGVCVMLVSVCVVLGFQSEVRRKVRGFGSDIQVLNYESLGSEQYRPIVVDSALMARVSALPHVAHVQRFCVKPGMLKTSDAFRGVMFRGVAEEFDSTFLASHLLEGRMPAFSATRQSGALLVSHQLARQMGLGVGSAVYAYFFEQGIRARKFTVSGIYRTNLTDFDKHLVYCDLSTVHQLLGFDSDQQSGLDVSLADNQTLEAMHHLVEAIGHSQDAYGAYYTSMTLGEMYPQIFAWLTLLDMDVWAILILMTCVAGFTMISGLLIIILERTNFIGVMKALGASNGRLRRLFLCFASLIIVRGIVLGCLMAGVLIGVQMQWGVVRLDAEVYYVDAVPLIVDWGYMLLICASTLVVSVMALLLPSSLVSHIHPARSIRFE